MKRISLQCSMLLATLFLFAFSCQDHYVPEEPMPEEPTIQTLALTVENSGLDHRYKVNVQSLGNVPITGYGIVSSANYNGNLFFTETPTLNNVKLPFAEAIGVGEKSLLHAAPQPGYTRLFYRAYVTYGANSVAYGNVLEFSPVPLKEAKIATREYLKNGAQTEYRVFFEDLGDIRIAEYGILMNIKESVNDQDYSVEPKIDAYDKKLPFSAVLTKEGLQSLIVNDPESLNYFQRYYRAYAILENGSVVYGQVMGLD